jgi:hypothetical protein
LEYLELYNKPKAEVHPGHMLTGPKEEEGGGGGEEEERKRRKVRKSTPIEYIYFRNSLIFLYLVVQFLRITSTLPR